MKKLLTLLLTLFVITLYGCSKREPEPIGTNTSKAIQEVSEPQYPASLTCFIGELGSGSNCETMIGKSSEGASNLNLADQKMSCGHPGKVSEIEFNFVEHKDKKDIYNFTRLFPSDTNEPTKSSNIVEFNGDQIVVFQDEYQVIVIDSPAKQ